MHLERTGDRRRWLLLGAVASVAVVAAACLPPPPPPPPTTTTTTTTLPKICGIGATSASADAPSDDTGKIEDRYVAVVESNGHSKVLTRHVGNEAEIAQFRADAEAQGDVTAFAPDGEVHALDQTPTWGFTDSGFSTAWSVGPPSKGSSVRVAVLDTGVLASHPDLAGHFDPAPAGADFTVDPDNPTLGVSTDPNGHGTHVSGIVAASDNTIGVVGGAPDVTLVPVRVLGSSGGGSFSAVAQGLLWAADPTKGNATVISMSLGGGDDFGVVGTVLESIEDPANVASTHPVVVIAAGNSACSSPSYPAAYAGVSKYTSSTPVPDTNPPEYIPPITQVLAVSALCKPGVTTRCSSQNPFPSDPYRLANFSSLAWNGVGSPTGIAAPGVAITSTWPYGDKNVLSDYASLDGTSMATPFVAAAAALVVAHCPGDSANQVVSRLEQSADDLGPSGPDMLYGFGKLDAAGAVASC